MAALQDPFAFVRDEVEQSVTNMTALFQRWTELDQSGDVDELEWTSTELKNQLKSIDWDLIDLNDTIKAVEEAPSRFKFTPDEIRSRKEFISRTQQTVKQIRDTITQRERQREQFNMRRDLKKRSTPAAPQAMMEGGGADGQMDMQMMLERRQGEQLEIVSTRVQAIGNIAQEMNEELDRQAEDLELLETDIEDTTLRLATVMGRLERLLHLTSDKRKYIAIIILVIILVAAIMYYIAG